MRIRILSLLSFCMMIHDAFATIPAMNTSTNGPTANSNFGTQVQQNTGQALQIFQDVNYKKLSGAQDQNYFFGDDENPDLSALAEQFKLAPEN